MHNPHPPDHEHSWEDGMRSECLENNYSFISGKGKSYQQAHWNPLAPAAADMALKNRFELDNTRAWPVRSGSSNFYTVYTLYSMCLV